MNTALSMGVARAIVLAMALILGPAWGTVGTAHAQIPPATGSAAGLGGTAVTESLGSDAILWNPALVGIDNAERSFEFLSFDFDNLPGGDWLRDAHRLELIGRGGNLSESLGLHSALPSNGAPAAAGSVTWASLRTSDLAVALYSQVFSVATVPEELQLAAEGLARPNALSARYTPGLTASPDASKSTASIIALSKAPYAGELPVIGKVWTGITLKGWYLHQLSGSRFGKDAFSAHTLSETRLSGVGGYGIDLGMFARPTRFLRVGVAVSNIQSDVTGSGDADLQIRQLEVDESGALRIEPDSRVSLPVAPDDVSPEIESLRSAAAFPKSVRWGLAFDLPVGTFAISGLEIMEAGGIIPEWLTDRVTFGYRSSGRVPVRFAVGSGMGQLSLTGGLVFGRCSRRWSLSGGRRSGDMGTSYSIAAGLAFADSTCSYRSTP